MFPTCSKRDLAGRNALSATDLTICSSGRRLRPAPVTTRVFDGLALRHPQPSRHGGAQPAGRPARTALGRRLGGMFPAPWGRRSPQAPTRSMRPRRASARSLALAALAVARLGPRRLRRRRRAPGRDEPEGEFPVEVVAAKFPTDQRLAQTSDLELAIENTGDEDVPDLAVTIFTGDEPVERLVLGPLRPARPRRPEPAGLDPRERLPEAGHAGDVEGPRRGAAGGAEAAQTNTFSFGPLPPGESQRDRLALTPVQAGTYTVHYELAAGLDGKAKAVTADGSPVEGEFVVTITDKPPQARVNDAGKVVIAGRPSVAAGRPSRRRWPSAVVRLEAVDGLARRCSPRRRSPRAAATPTGAGAADRRRPPPTQRRAAATLDAAGGRRSATGDGGVELARSASFEQPVYVTQPPRRATATSTWSSSAGAIQRVPDDGGEPEHVPRHLAS